MLDTPRPFLKWAGGKSKLLSELMRHVPERFRYYHEPFLGGGAMFFALRRKGFKGLAFLSDSNRRLIKTYAAIGGPVELVIEALKKLPCDKETFLKIRGWDVEDMGAIETAVWMIYLNKTCFNGLYRVNKKGHFNTPFGKWVDSKGNPKTPDVCTEGNLRACNKALLGATLLHDDFSERQTFVAPEDFIYFDPPYVPMSETSNFTGYTKGGFTLDDQERVRDCALRLKKGGVNVLLSNSDTRDVRRLYENGFEMRSVSSRRSINSKASGRGAVSELIIW